MKLKVTLLVLSLAAVLGLSFVVVPENGEVDANNSWTNQAINNAYSDMLDTAHETNEELAKIDVNSHILATFEPKIKTEQELLAEMLEEYYQLQLNNLTETDRYKQLEKQIEELKVSIFNSFKSEIDKMFE